MHSAKDQLAGFVQWSHSGSTDKAPAELEHNVCVISCMDQRLDRSALRERGYQIRNAGPRFDDSVRSAVGFLQLANPQEELIMLWFSHDAICGCSSLENNKNRDPKVIEPYSISTRDKEVTKLLQNPAIAEAIRSGRLCLAVGVEHIDENKRIRPEIDLLTTTRLLQEAGLPAV